MPPKKTTTPMFDTAIKALVARSMLTHWQNMKQTEAEMEMTTTIQEGAEEGRVESVFHISNYTVENEVKFASCTLIGVALTWWNSHVKIVSRDAAYGMLWKTLMKMMTDKYCPLSEIKKLEIKIWNLKMKGTNVGSVMASKPKTMQEAIEIANDLMDQKVRAYAVQATPQWVMHYKVRELQEGHYKSDCPELKNQNHENQAKGTKARRMVYALGGGENNQNIDDMEDDINA
uniref:Retrotransposon gag domain-containing protein n=1 Tax=Tanacetum cinerariifolium TaxID=118510 RepID=A0A699H137_TANCI|nr:hypothetical protein [Tanacetum cinerariifolium]